jgi:hypothetical protein
MTRASESGVVDTLGGPVVVLTGSGDEVVGAAVAWLAGPGGPLEAGAPPSTVQAESTTKAMNNDLTCET